MNLSRTVGYACAAVLAAVLAGCGQYGELYLPERKTEAPPKQPSEPGTPPDGRADSIEEP